jgi:predicted ester cyclase
MADERDRNKAVVRAHFAALNAGDADAFADTADPDGRNHAPAPFDLSEWPANGKPFGPADLRETLEWLRAGSPDLHVEIEDLIAEGDEVVAWVRMTGTQTGARGPIPPTGRAVNFRHAQRFRLRNGRIIEHWAVRDDLRAMIQAGVITPPGPPSA